jgi:hypothetical protein
MRTRDLGGIKRKTARPGGREYLLSAVFCGRQTIEGSVVNCQSATIRFVLQSTSTTSPPLCLSTSRSQVEQFPLLWLASIGTFR